MTIDYDKCPEAYDLQELVERADFAVTYLGNKIRDMVARGILVKQSVMSSPPTFTMTPDHNWEITGYVQMCDSPIRYNYVAKLYMQTSETDKITISRSDVYGSKTVDLTQGNINLAIAELPEPEENTTICEVCGKPGAYATPVDPNHKICCDCRELLHCNHTGWVTSDPEADKHGGKGY